MPVVRKLNLVAEEDSDTGDLIIRVRYDLRRGDVTRELSFRVPIVDLSESDKAARWGFAPSLKHRKQLMLWFIEQLSKMLDAIQDMPARPPKKATPPIEGP